MTSRITVVEGGRMVDSGIERIAQVIKDYDENLELAWIPPERRIHQEEYPFAVLYNNPSTGIQEVVMKLRETEIDHRIIARLWYNDNRNGSVLDRIEAEEAAKRAVDMLEEFDRTEEAKELAAWMVKAKPGSKHNGIVLQ